MLLVSGLSIKYPAICRYCFDCCLAKKRMSELSSSPKLGRCASCTSELVYFLAVLHKDTLHFVSPPFTSHTSNALRFTHRWQQITMMPRASPIIRCTMQGRKQATAFCGSCRPAAVSCNPSMTRLFTTSTRTTLLPTRRSNTHFYPLNNNLISLQFPTLD